MAKFIGIMIGLAVGMAFALTITGKRSGDRMDELHRNRFPRLPRT
ncbi:MAG: hypothetical protein AB7I29_13730 [Geobacter sp.]